MKVTTELRQVIESKCDTHRNRSEALSDFLKRSKSAKRDIGIACEKLRRLLDEIEKTKDRCQKKWGICPDEFMFPYVRDCSMKRFVEVSGYTPKPPASMVIARVSELPHKEAVSFLKTLGIDWS